MSKLKTLEINCDKLTTGRMYKNGRYCSVGFYVRKIKNLPTKDVVEYDIVDDENYNELNDIMEINDSEELTWKAKAKEITKLFKKMNVRVIWKNASWK
jgi:succinate dehydrogenase flavin-adding protein (antitoxin of CptAB toxin-antitoxin module)